jgi:hypothetical protein
MPRDNAGLMQEVNKAHLINHLAEVHGYRHYLELCTGTTGNRYAEIDRSKFLTCRRLTYRCPDGHDDGMSIDYRSSDNDIGDCLTKIGQEGRVFDIILVDPYHDYATSWRDLKVSFQLIKSGGTLVVHDCLPPRLEVATPEFIPGERCGTTYQAFIDFVSERDDLSYYTVDTDYGCSIIRKLSAPSAWRLAATSLARSWQRSLGRMGSARRYHEVLEGWKRVRGDHEAAFRFLQAHRDALLNLISTEQFFQREHLNPYPGAEPGGWVG